MLSYDSAREFISYAQEVGFNISSVWHVPWRTCCCKLCFQADGLVFLKIKHIVKCDR